MQRSRPGAMSASPSAPPLLTSRSALSFSRCLGRRGRVAGDGWKLSVREGWGEGGPADRQARRRRRRWEGRGEGRDCGDGCEIDGVLGAAASGRERGSSVIRSSPPRPRWGRFWAAREPPDAGRRPVAARRMCGGAAAGSRAAFLLSCHTAVPPSPHLSHGAVVCHRRNAARRFCIYPTSANCRSGDPAAFSPQRRVGSIASAADDHSLSTELWLLAGEADVSTSNQRSGTSCRDGCFVLLAWRTAENMIRANVVSQMRFGEFGRRMSSGCRFRCF